MLRKFRFGKKKFYPEWNRRAFTLIEILVVIFIIALLVSISVVIFNRSDFQKKTRDNQRKKDVNELSAAIEQFKADHGHYPYINWGTGVHAYSVLGLTCPNDPLDRHGPDGTYGAYYSPDARDCNDTDCGDPALAWYPGTELVYQNGHACDDLSLQLLGLAYLPQMAPDDEEPDDEEDKQGLWVTSASPPELRKELRKYLDDIPREPAPEIKIRNIDDPNCDPATDSYCEWNPFYFYNSFYDCWCEKVYYGDRYWIQAQMELDQDGERGPEDPGDEHGFVFYEQGTINWNRRPQSQCGC